VVIGRIPLNDTDWPDDADDVAPQAVRVDDGQPSEGECDRAAAAWEAGRERALDRKYGGVA